MRRLKWAQDRDSILKILNGGVCTIVKISILKSIILTALITLLALSLSCLADTFMHREKGEVLHGFATSRLKKDKTVVHTQERGSTALKLSDWTVTPDRTGRNNKIVALKIDERISLRAQAAAFENAMIKAADEGPLFVLLEVDSTGGNIVFVMRICEAILNSNCEVICFVNGGRYNGATGSCAAIALACDKIYMTEHAILGAATPVTLSKPDYAEVDEILNPGWTERLNQAWKDYFSILAQENGRSELLAEAMVDKDIEVIEVHEGNLRKFIEPEKTQPMQSVTRTWSEKDSLLTLTSTEALQCGFAEKIVDSQKEVLRELSAEQAVVVTDDEVQQAERTFKKVKMKFDRLRSSLDLKIKRVERTENVPKAMTLLREIRDDYKSLLQLARRHPDLSLDVELLQEQVDFVERSYRRAKRGG